MPFISVPSTFLNTDELGRRLSAAVNALGRGRSNAVGQFVLADNTTLTTVIDVNMASSSIPTFAMLDAGAIAEGIPGVDSRANGSFVVSHGSSTATRTFGYCIQG